MYLISRRKGLREIVNYSIKKSVLMWHGYVEYKSMKNEINLQGVTGKRYDS